MMQCRMTNRPTRNNITFLNEGRCEMLPLAYTSKLAKTITEQGSQSNDTSKLHDFFQDSMTVKSKWHDFLSNCSVASRLACSNKPAKKYTLYSLLAYLHLLQVSHYLLTRQILLQYLHHCSKTNYSWHNQKHYATSFSHFTSFSWIFMAIIIQSLKKK